MEESRVNESCHREGAAPTIATYDMLLAVAGRAKISRYSDNRALFMEYRAL